MSTSDTLSWCDFCRLYCSIAFLVIEEILIDNVSCKCLCICYITTAILHFKWFDKVYYITTSGYLQTPCCGFKWAQKRNLCWAATDLQVVYMSHHAFALVSILAVSSCAFLCIYLQVPYAFFYAPTAVLILRSTFVFWSAHVTGEASHGVTRWLGAHQAGSCKASIQISFTAASQI